LSRKNPKYSGKETLKVLERVKRITVHRKLTYLFAPAIEKWTNLVYNISVENKP
jgi:hypothetical protein